MTTFGFSAFLKLVHLNERPKRTELRKRLRGSSERGYDYHRSLRGLARRLMLDRDDIASVLAGAEQIKKLPERSSAKSGLLMLDRWRDAKAGHTFESQKVTVESPAGRFKVSFLPDFGAQIGGVKTSVHIWNTMKPPLTSRMVFATLAPFYDQIATQGFEAIAVLSLRDGQIFSLSNPVPYLEHSTLILEHIEALIEDLDDDGRRPPAEDRPSI